MAKAKKSTKKAVKKTRSQFYVIRTVREARDKLTGMVRDYNEKYAKNLFKAGKEFIEGVEKDARKALDDFVHSGKKTLQKIPVVKTVEKKVDSGMKTVSAQLSLPSKKDIEKLTRSVKALNNKVENLNKQYTA